MTLLRLDKLISDTGRATRSEARALIRAGRVTIDGAAVLSPEAKFDGETAVLRIDGDLVSYSRFRYIMMDKPAGLLSACEDARQKTVLDLLPQELRRQGLFPVGRLDKDTTGLLLLTNDGDFSHRITSPKGHVQKKYLARVDALPRPGDAEAFARGLVLGDGTPCLPAALELCPQEENSVYVTVSEGKFHQVKRMLALRGMNVLALRRLSIGGLALDAALGPGGYKELLPAEKASIFCF